MRAAATATAAAGYATTVVAIPPSAAINANSPAGATIAACALAVVTFPAGAAGEASAPAAPATAEPRCVATSPARPSLAVQPSGAT
jgi:hypothetical protein